MQMRIRLALAGLIVGCLAACGERSTPVEESFPGEASAKLDTLRDDVEDALDSTVAALKEELRIAQETYGRDMAQKEGIIEELRGQIADRETRLGPKMDAIEALSMRNKWQRRELKAVPASHWLSRLASEDSDTKWNAIDFLARWHVSSPGVLERLLRLALSEDERFGSRMMRLLAEYWRNPEMGPTLLELIKTSEETDLVGAALELCRRPGTRARSLLPELESLDFSDRHTPKVRKQLKQVISELKPK